MSTPSAVTATPGPNLSDPQSLIGATPEEILALKPAGWLVRPFPAGHPGFRMISPGRMPGALNSTQVHGAGTPGYRAFSTRPGPGLFVLNEAVEYPLLVQVFIRWAGTKALRAAAPGISALAEAAQRLIREGLIRAYRDPLHGQELMLLDEGQALDAVADVRNWWRDEADTTVEPATSVIVVEITDRGRRALAAAPGPGSGK